MNDTSLIKAAIAFNIITYILSIIGSLIYAVYYWHRLYAKVWIGFMYLLGGWFIATFIFLMLQIFLDLCIDIKLIRDK